MASYRVPQDVEADDKLLGPFSARQFVYLAIACVGVGAAWGLFLVAPFLVVLPFPVILIFGVLALPLKKDQPMETYVAALISFHIKPQKRLWRQEGEGVSIEITAPKSNDGIVERQYGDAEMNRRLSFLTQLADSEGWSIKDGDSLSSASQSQKRYMHNDYSYDVDDMMDTQSDYVKRLDERLSQSNQAHKQALMESMNRNYQEKSDQRALQSVTQNRKTISAMDYARQQYQNYTQSREEQSSSGMVNNSMSEIAQNSPNQSSGATPLAKFRYQSENSVSKNTPLENAEIKTPAVMEDELKTKQDAEYSAKVASLASNNDLSIETIAKQAHNLDKKQRQKEEVVVSWR